MEVIDFTSEDLSYLVLEHAINLVAPNSTNFDHEAMVAFAIVPKLVTLRPPPSVGMERELLEVVI